MHNRLRAGWRRLTLAAAVASLLAVPAAEVLAAGFGPVRPGDRIDVVASPEPTSKKPLLFPRSNYLWPFEAGPVYGEVDSTRFNAPGVVHTAVGTFDLATGWPTFPAALRTSVKFGQLPAQYFVLQVDPSAYAEGSFDAIREAITAGGGAIVREMPVAAYVARLTPSGYGALQGLPGVLALEPYHPALKLDPSIGRVPLADSVKALSDVYTLDIRLFPGEDANAVAASIQALGGNVTLVTGDSITVDLNRAQLAAVAGLEPVASIHENVPVFTKGEETSVAMEIGGGEGWTRALPYHEAGIDGSGGGKAGATAQVLGVLDSGIQLDAADLSDTRTNAGTPGVSHRKVVHYASTNSFGGTGDLLGCDVTPSGGYTHGHTVSSGALGNASDVPLSFGGAGYFATDSGNNQWSYDGVAPGAKLVAYDAQQTPTTGGCDDPGQGGLFVGDLYSSPSGGSLGEGYTTHGAKTFNFSWGATQSNTYSSNASDVDDFLFDKKDAMVFIAAGNDSADTNQDGIPDPSTVSTPATAKSAVVVGASFSANVSGTGPNARVGFSSVGPVVTGATNCATSPNACRVAPLLMAPGADAGGLGVASEYNCRSLDNDQINPVQCDQVDGLSGTSFASPAAAGAALVVRDYFAQGFYPDGTDTNPGNGADQVLNVSGALVKSILIASADWMNSSSAEFPNDPGSNLLRKYRFNNEQGYGRIQLNKALPISTYDSPLGLVVCDPNVCNTSGISGTVPASTTQTHTFQVTDTSQPLTAALAWVEPSGSTLARNLNVELQAPSGLVYWGNFFTDDDDKSGAIGTGEGCNYTTAVPWPGSKTGSSNLLDTGPWSIPTSGTGVTCTAPDRDTVNPTEAIFISNDPAGNGTVDVVGTPIDESADNQIEVGTWTLRVINASGSPQDIGLALAGPVQLGSSVRIQRLRSDETLASGAFICNDKARLVVNEIAEGTDAINNNAAEVSGRTTVQVIDAGTDGIFGTGDDVVTDTETGIPFTDTDGAGAGLRFESSDLFLTDGTAPDPGNGALDIRSGQRVRVTYQDEDNGVPNTNKKRVSEGSVDCRTQIVAGGVVWSQFGRDATTFINGGCEKDLRGLFTFGFPDKYMDAGEVLGYRIAFLSQEAEALEDVEVSLKAVAVDGDSPEDCTPNTVGVCTDPNRTNNAVSPYITIFTPDQTLGRVGSNSAVSANFTVQMASSIPANTEIELVLGVSARKSGKPVDSFVVSRHRLDVDEVSFFYSTDFPNSGTENRDVNNNEYIEAITTSARDFDLDYVVESRSFSNLKANGKNPNVEVWNFDTGRQGWTVGVTNVSNIATVNNVAQWGEDKNYNNVLDAGEDRDPVNGTLDYAWSTRGGCGWQTSSGQATGGIWHTGRIDVTTLANCVVGGAVSGQCQRFETVSGFFGNNVWYELLLSPELEKVNQCPTGAEPGCNGRVDAEGRPVYDVEFTNWAWNMSMDIPGTESAIIYELDTDTEKILPIDLFNDFSVLNFVFGTQGAVSGGNAPITDGFNLFANVSKCVDTNGDTVVDRCGNISGPVCTSDAECTGLSFNGTVGNNRSGKNSCFFEGKDGGGLIKAKEPYGLALPLDDDLANGYCVRNDSLNGVDRSKSCTVATAATDCSAGTNPAFTGVCQTANAVADEYVTANGPIRNYDIGDANGPDMRFTTLEDFYGASGKKFQASMGFYTQEGTPSALPTAGFGVAFDDPVIEWREFRLDPDTTNCGTPGAAECASLELAQTNMFEGSAVIQVTVLDRSPKNDCNNDGDVLDAGDDADCDNDGIREVYVRALSEGEAGGETFKANEVVPNEGRFAVNIPTSFSYNSPSTLFVTPSSPFARVQYKDWDDGTGAICGNATDPEQRGILEESTLLAVDAGRLSLKGVRVVDVTGDGDGFADDGEEVELFLSITNKSGVDLTDVSVSIQAADTTSAARIACISRPTVTLGSLANRAFAETAIPLKFTVGTVGRTAGEVDDSKLITFNVTIRSDKFDALTRNVQFSLDADLNASGGSGLGNFTEDFETKGSFVSFTTMGLDAGRESLSGSNGFRCQYNDPDSLNSNDPGRTTCYMGNTANAYDWHNHDGSASQNGITRAYTGSRSLHWGVHPNTGAKRDTTRLSQLDAVRSNLPINIATGSTANPELSFFHQISLADNRITNTPAGEAADRAVVHIQLADSAGTAVGNWLKIYPYENEYDARGTDLFSNCTFDPTDDGNTEDDFFDPSDPFRRKGPSSTCDPEFAFVFHGDTDYRSTTPDLTKIGRAFDGPGFPGSAGPGTWVQPKFALSQYKGRRLRLRFVATSIEVFGAATYNDLNIGSDNEVGEDGWYIDNIVVSDTLSTAATLAADTTNLFPTGCVACSSVTASLTFEPPSSPAPGQPVSLSAGGSSADSCLDGALQYRFFDDLNDNGVYDSGVDALLRDWTDNAGLLDAPLISTNYGVSVRCSSSPTCASTAAPPTYVVACPSTGSSVSPFNGDIGVRKTAPEVTWSVSQSFDAVQISGNTLRSSGGDFNLAKESCVLNNGSGTSLTWNPAVTPGQWKAILLRPGGATFCNATGSYSSNAPTEAAGRDSEIGNICP